jgi:hypothetical protein
MYRDLQMWRVMIFVCGERPPEANVNASVGALRIPNAAGSFLRLSF